MFDRQALVAAFETIGAAALAEGTRLELAVYGGAALMLASNFRFATEDVDIAEIGTAWPDWLTAVVAEIAARNGWAEDWLNDAVTFHLSPSADRAADHIAFGSFPQEGAPGLCVLVPTAPYLLALELRACLTTGVDLRRSPFRMIGRRRATSVAPATVERVDAPSAEKGSALRVVSRRPPDASWRSPIRKDRRRTSPVIRHVATQRRPAPVVKQALKAMRVLDAAKGEREAADIRGLMRTLDVDAGGAMAILRRYFPNTAADGGKQLFLLRHLGSSHDGDGDAPRYGR